MESIEIRKADLERMITEIDIELIQINAELKIVVIDMRIFHGSGMDVNLTKEQARLYKTKASLLSVREEIKKEMGS